ncbi:MAG: glycosyltransferase family 9 protein, partial [bacterium]
MRGLKRVFKAAERANKRVVTFLLSKTVRAQPAKVDPTTVSRVLFLRYDRLGDMIISTPLFRIVKESYPNWRIGVLGTPRNIDVVEEDPNVDDIFLFTRSPLRLIRTVRAIRHRQYDVVVNLVFYKSLTGGLLANILVPNAVKVAVDNGNLNFLYNLSVHIRGENETHIVERTLQLLEVFSIDPSQYDRRPHLTLGLGERERATSFLSSHQGEGDDGLFVGFNLSAGKPECRWTLEKYAECALRIRERYPYVTIVFFATSKDVPLASALQGLLQGSTLVCPPSRRIREVAAVVEWMDLLVTPDTGMVHVASALEVPVVGLFTRLKSTPQSWGPYGIPYRVLIAPDREPVAAIGSDEVFRAISDLLDEVEPINFEIRNTKSETNSNERNTKSEAIRFRR